MSGDPGYRDSFGVGLLVLMAIGVVGYMLFRVNGMFASNDVTVYTQVAAAIKESGSLITQPTYSNGFGYPTIVALISSFTGLSVTQLQVFVLPNLLVLPVLSGYITFRRILDSRRGLFAAILMLFNPFFLFSAFRTTHEKFTYTFIFLAIFCLYATFATQSYVTRGRYILVGYLSILGIIFLNVFFASSFIVAVAISLGCTFLLSLYYGQRLELERLEYTLGVSFALLMIVILFLFPPARKFITSLGRIFQQSLFLFLGNAPSATAGSASPYQSVFTGWNSFSTYLALISYYLVVYPVAGVYWLARSWKYLKTRSLTRSEIPALFIHLLFFVFGVQLTVAIVADQAGAVGANTQLRIFPLLGFIAVILATTTAYQLLDTGSSTSSSDDSKRVGSSIGLRSHVVPVVLIMLVLSFGIAGMVKATNEPAVSNNWAISTDNEQVMTEWTERHLHSEYLWGGFGARARYSYLIDHPSERLQNRYDPGEVDLVVEYLTHSETIRKRAEIADVPLPPRDDAAQVYTNGGAQVYWFSQYRTLDEYNAAFARSQR